MSEFCFETINWSPYFGVENPDLVRLVKAAGAAGFEWISFDQMLLDAYRTEGGSFSSLRQQVEDQGLRTLAIHTTGIGDDPEAAVLACRPLAEAAAALGAPYVHVGATVPLGPALYDATNQAARVVGDAGAALAFEFLPFLDVASIEDTRTLLASIEAEGAGLVVDSWHFIHGPDDWPQLAELSEAEIAYVQFDDHPALESEDLLEETTQRRVYPGDGVFDLTRFARTIEETGFDGVIGLELLSAAHRALPVEEVARDLLAASRRYWETPAPAGS